MDQHLILHFKASRALLDMGKFSLILLDELYKDSENAKALFFKTLEKCQLTDSQVELLKSVYEQAEVLNANKKALLRKRILDFGGDVVRSIDKEFEKNTLI